MRVWVLITLIFLRQQLQVSWLLMRQHQISSPLQVDLYDEEAAAPVLDTPDFYRHCRELLSQQGCMTVNLFGRSSSYAESVEKICAAFGEEAVWAFKPTREGNAIVLAQRTASRPSREALIDAAAHLEEKWGLPASKWLKVFKPLSK